MRIVVIPASKHGGTAEMGRAIADTLRNRGFEVDVSQPEHMLDLSPYGAHIIGSAVYLGDWLDRASRFVEKNQEALRQKPTWLFSSGPLGPARPDVPVNSDVVDRLMNLSGAQEHRLFSGRLNTGQLSRTERFIAKWVGATDGDHREWGEIEDWANTIADEMSPTSYRIIDGIGRDHR